MKVVSRTAKGKPGRNCTLIRVELLALIVLTRKRRKVKEWTGHGGRDCLIGVGFTYNNINAWGGSPARTGRPLHAREVRSATVPYLIGVLFFFGIVGTSSPPPPPPTMTARSTPILCRVLCRRFCCLLDIRAGAIRVHEAIDLVQKRFPLFLSQLIIQQPLGWRTWRTPTTEDVKFRCA